MVMMMTGKQLSCNLLIVINPVCLSKTLLESSLACSRCGAGHGRMDPLPILSLGYVAWECARHCERTFHSSRWAQFNNHKPYVRGRAAGKTKNA